MLVLEWPLSFECVRLLLEWCLRSVSPVLEWYWTNVMVEWCRIGVLEYSCVGARVALKLCFTSAGVVLGWWWSGVVLVSWGVVVLVLGWPLSCASLVLEWCWNGVVVVVEWCRSVEYSVVMLLLEWYLSSFSQVLEWYWTNVVVVEWFRIGVLECSCVGARVALKL